MNKKHNLHHYIPHSSIIEEHGNIHAFAVEPARIIEVCSTLYHTHALPLKTITAFDERNTAGGFKILYLFGIPGENIFLAPYIVVKDSFPSLTPTIHEASLYERKIKTFFGLTPEGHPDARSLILHDENWPQDVYPLRKDFNWQTRPEIATKNPPFAFHKIQGEGIYELPVGPVHAGIIEPGHFRFNLAGEEILLLEPRLGYSHKGCEKLFETLPLNKKLELSERIVGDSSFHYSLAFCQTIETLSGAHAPERAQYIRTILGELERLANHFGDIGAIMTDTGFNFGGAQGSRLREEVLRMNERLTGSRFLRGVNQIGGVLCDLQPIVQTELQSELETLKRDFTEVIEIAQDSSSLLNRLKETGVLDQQVAKDHGITGIAGRAVGIMRDARVDYPYAAYPHTMQSIVCMQGGDVYARFMVRVEEVYTSFTILLTALQKLPQGPLHHSAHGVHPLKKDTYAVSIVEGWRGDIVCLVSTDEKGEITRIDMRDPSFLNWSVVGYAGRGNMVPDFPLINKSFSLSYTGNDQ